MEQPGSRAVVLSVAGDRQPQDTIGQARLDLVRVEVARQSEVALEIAEFVLVIDRTVPFGRMLLNCGVNIEDAPVKSDRQALRLGSWHVCQQHQPAVRLTYIYAWPEGSAGPGPLPGL